MIRRPRRILAPLLLLAAALTAIYLTRTFWLTQLGQALVYRETPAKADLAVVLAGDPDGRRVEKAAQATRW